MEFKAMQTAAKKIAKSEKLFIVNKNNTFYILDGYFMLVVNEGIYDNIFRTSDVTFCDVPEGKQASRNTKSEKVLTISDNPIKVEQFILHESVHRINKTRFYMNIPIGKKECPAAIFATDNNNLIVVNNTFMDYITPFCGNDGFVQPDSLKAEKESYSAIYSREWVDINSPDFTAAAMILPIRNDIKTFDYTIKYNGGNEAATDKSDKKASAIIADAEEKAEAIKTAAMNEAQNMIKKAKAEAKQIEKDAKDAAEQGIKRLIAEAGEMALKEGTEAADKILSDATEEAKAIVIEAMKKRDEILQTANNEAEHIKQTATTPCNPTADIQRNEACNGIEIYFKAFPSYETRSELKQNGFRWHSTKKCWYAKATEKNIALAEKIAA